jgi:hypothetical protein
MLPARYNADMTELLERPLSLLVGAASEVLLKPRGEEGDTCILSPICIVRYVDVIGYLCG